MEGFAYFSSIIYRDERPDLVDSLLPICVNYLNENKNDLNFTQSKFLGLDERLVELKNYLLISSTNILRDQGYDINKYDFYISGLWAQEIKLYGHSDIHVHKNSQITGWVFLEVPKDGAYAVYYDNRINKNMIELDMFSSESILNGTSIINFNNMKPGTILFNNSWLSHQLCSGQSSIPTRCIHFIISHRDRLCNFY